MKKNYFLWNQVRICMACFILLTQAVLFLDAFHMHSRLEPLNFFGYWTNQGNLLSAITLVILIVQKEEKIKNWSINLRFIATVNITMVTVLYWAFVKGDDVGVRFAWANYEVHLFTGVFMILDWIIIEQAREISLKKFWIAVLYPCAWLVVTGIRFLIDGWVPYSVLEPQNGFLAIAQISVAFLIASLIFGFLFLLFSTIMNKHVFHRKV